MKRLISYTVSSLLLAFVLLIMKKTNDLPQDLYQLSDAVFLEKVDYFSNYKLLRKSNGDYETIDVSITLINKIADLIIYYSNSTKEYCIITGDAEVQGFKDMESISNQYHLGKISLLPPRKFIEEYKKYDLLKTIREITLILIVLFIILIFKEVIVKLKSKNG
ncbi:hypothetical protein [Maribellus maritimus]|uniref:hypothetical protein n=1 Tax=Maribellus maritimus TaxID=2870838 RepID=UPI001EEA40E9|nr:hypothetical protein [Maribellus maritimus]MCG6187670.1 hypothetical protein [Maribellus maritimus]